MDSLTKLCLCEFDQNNNLAFSIGTFRHLTDLFVRQSANTNLNDQNTKRTARFVDSTPENNRLREYRDQLQEQSDMMTQLAWHWGWVGYLRGLMFLASFGLLFCGLTMVMGQQQLWFLAAGIVFFAFLVVAFFHEGMQSKYRTGKLLAKMHRESVARLERNWPAINVPEFEVPKHQIALAKDLDLIGPSSLFKLLGIVRTPLGINTLAHWILNPALPDEVLKRQVAVKELSGEKHWRENFQLKCETLASSQAGPSQFVNWCESEDFFDRNGWLLWASRILLMIAVAAIGLTLIQVLPLTISGPTLIVLFVINFILTVFNAGSIHEEFNMISTRHHEITYYRELFDMMSRFESKSGKLVEIQQGLFGESEDVRKHMRSLGTLVWLANFRRDAIFFLPYLFLQFFGFWDVHILKLLENWKKKHGSKAQKWFKNLGQWESLCAMAKLAHDQPDWIFPEFGTDQVVACEVVGHPLLSDSTRVNNDCQTGPPGSVLLVTGSNMSGKSTLLRSIGLNVALAQMGGVVCAKSMTLCPLVIATSMRISDSLADGVSFFMAELTRLKEIVDQAETLEQDKQWNMLFLLDEILQGTNSRERQIAVSRVVRRLIDGNAIGCISTHDLDLAKTEDLQDCCNTVHFCEGFEEADGESKMTFDYKMHEGISPTTNALKLLEMVGLGETRMAKK